MIEIRKATKTPEYKVIEKLASEILPGVYDHIISSEQRAHFMNEFQTEKAINYQVNYQNRTYYLLNYNKQSVGYFAFDIKSDILQLSKLYILEAFRGKKIGKTALNFIFEFGVKKNISVIELMVNQENYNSIKAYESCGFTITKSVINSFPNGFKVQDYKMEKKLNN